jgi:hypothetical protein
MPLREGTRGLRWPLRVNERGGFDLTSPDAGGMESLRQVIGTAHMPRRSLDPYAVRDQVGGPDSTFAPLEGRIPAEQREHIERFFARLERQGRARLMEGPTIVEAEPNTGRIVVAERVRNLESGDEEEVLT